MLATAEKWSNYTAFGSPMPGRNPNAGSNYRYGFNGKENDNNINSTGDGAQDYGMRIYNPSLGKFLSVDPIGKDFAYYSPYQFAGNKPIAAIDLDGLEDVYFTEEDKKQYMQIAYTAEDIENLVSGIIEVKLRVHYEGKTTDQFEGPNKANEEKIFQQANDPIKGFIKKTDQEYKDKVKNKEISGYLRHPFKSGKYLIPKPAKIDHPSFKLQGNKADKAFIVSTYWNNTYVPGENALGNPYTKNGDLGFELVPELDAFAKNLKKSGAKSIDINVTLGQSIPGAAYTQGAMETASKRAAESIAEYLQMKIPELKINTKVGTYDSKSKKNKIDIIAK